MKKGAWVCLQTQYIAMKTSVNLKKKCACPRSRCADLQFLNFVIENEKVRKPFLPVNMGPRSNLTFKQKNDGRKCNDTVPLNPIFWLISSKFLRLNKKKLISEKLRLNCFDIFYTHWVNIN